MNERKLRPWPLLLMALPAAVAIWSGWVGLGELAGFGLVQPLPGILRFHLNTAITLPVGVEAYGAYALGAWLRPGTPDAARRFARWSAIGALGLGMLGQVAYHLLASSHASRAPVPVIVAVSCIPVVALGFGAALAHLLRAGGRSAGQSSERREWAPIIAAVAARIAPPRDTPEIPITTGTGEAPAVPVVMPIEVPPAMGTSVPMAGPIEVPPADTPREGDGGTHGDPIAGTPRDARRPPPPSAVAKVLRVGAGTASDDQVKAAIREMGADGPKVTVYRIGKELKGPKGGISDKRAARLLADVQAEAPDRTVVPIGSAKSVAGE